jgi:hypothetical protein
LYKGFHCDISICAYNVFWSSLPSLLHCNLHFCTQCIHSAEASTQFYLIMDWSLSYDLLSLKVHYSLFSLFVYDTSCMLLVYHHNGELYICYCFMLLCMLFKGTSCLTHFYMPPTYLLNHVWCYFLVESNSIMRDISSS